LPTKLRPIIRYVAPFIYEHAGDEAHTAWIDWREDDRDFYGSGLGFFLEAVRPIFEPTQGPNSRGLRHLRHPHDPGGRAYVLPSRVGIVVLEEHLDEIPPEPGLWLRQASSPGGAWYEKASTYVREIVPRARIDIYGRRLLTWVVWPVEGEPARAEERELLYCLTEHCRRDDPDTVRSEELLRLCRRQGVARWRAWSLLYHRDNAAALIYPACSRDPVRIQRMHRGDYFRLYLLGLYLKLQLLSMMTELVPGPGHRAADTGGDAVQLWRRYEATMDQFLTFRSHYWFAEVTHDTTGRLVYPRLCRALGVPGLMREVSEEVRTVHSRYSRKAEAQRRDDREELQERLNLLTWYLFPLAVTTGLLGMNVLVPESHGERPLMELLWFVGVLLSISLVMGLGLWSQRQRRQARVLQRRLAAGAEAAPPAGPALRREKPVRAPASGAPSS
jgi:hypothetical protein